MTRVTMTIEPKDAAHYLRLCLAVHSLTQSDLAKAAGLSRASVGAWCNGRHPRSNVLSVLSNALPIFDIATFCHLASREATP